MPDGLHLHRSQLRSRLGGRLKSGLRSQHSRSARGEWRAAAAFAHAGPPLAIAVGIVGAAWLLGAASHSAGIPRTDDWAWARVAFDLHRSGHLRLVGWGPMTMLGLVAWAQPWLAVFGAHMWVLDLSASVLIAAGLLAAWRLARLMAGERAALVVVATVALAPGFLRDASSFMTDGPAFGLAAVSLLAGFEAAAADGWRRRALEAACVASGFWAFSIREFALAAPLAVLGARWLSEPGRRRVLGGELAAVAGCGLAFWVWRSSLHGDQPYGGRPPVFTIIELVVGAVFTTSLLLVPVLAATAPRWWRARHGRARAIGMVAGAALAVVPIAYEPGSWNHRFQWLTGDYLDPRGINGNKLLLGSRPRVLPPLCWAGVEIVAVVAGMIVLGLAAEAIATRGSRPPTLATHVLVAYLAVTFIAIGVAIVRNGAVYDRYVWPMALSGAILLASAFRVPALWRWHPAAAQGALLAVAAFAAVSVLVTLNSDAFDGARWRAARAAGVAPASVDAGFEWVGSHASGVENSTATGDAERPYWVVMAGERAACVELAASPQAGPGLELVRVVHWRRWMAWGNAVLYEYRRPAACPQSG